MKKSIAISEVDFKSIIDNNYFFVDKSLLIKDILDDKFKVKLVMRPRRFGKTLNQSMLKYFFKIPDNSDTLYLFNNLMISNYNDIMKYQGKYPVISVSFKGVKGKSFNSSFDRIKQIVRDEFTKNKYLFNYDVLSNEEKIIIDIMSMERDNTFFEEENLYIYALYNLSKILYKSTGTKVVVLIDEYDIPLQYSFTNNYYDEMSSFMRDLFESLLKDNEYLYTSVITGCLKMFKENILSGFNNFGIYDITNDNLSKYYGFTEEEMHKILEYFNLNNSYIKIKDWYDGYVFGYTEIYNPFSTLQCIDKLVHNNINAFENYWVNSSGNTILTNLFDHTNIYSIRESFDLLINNGEAEEQINKALTYDDLRQLNNIWTVLLYTGYLKQVNNCGNNKYKLKIPNKEVLQSTIDLYNNYFENSLRLESHSKLIQSFIDCDVDSISLELNKIFRNFVSFYDCNESFYHGYLSCIMNQTNDFEVLSNRESGFGRFDLCLYDRFKSIGFIIEIKTTKDRAELKQKAELALQQILDKEYTRYLEFYDTKTIHIYGISFCKNECLIVGK